MLCISCTSAGLSAAASQSPWANSTNSKARLVSGSVEIDGKPTMLAGIQLRMAPGWKTYWRNPGDSGVPPDFDWSGSVNLKHAEVLFPAPHRFADGNSAAIGYDDEVVLPVKITPEREGEPVELKLALDYGTCMDLCIPNEARLDLVLPAVASGRGDALLIKNALARVPKPAAPGTLPEVSGVDATLDAEKPGLFIDAVFAPDARDTDLFIEAEGVFVPVPAPLGPPDGGKQRFAVTFASQAEAAALKGKKLRLTLVSDLGSTETVWTPE